MAEIAVKSVLSVADIPRRDVRFDLIKLTVSTDHAIFHIDQNGRQARGYGVDSWTDSGQGFFASSDVEIIEGCTDLSVNMSF